MPEIPKTLDGAIVLYHTVIDQRHQATGKCSHTVAGELLGAASGLAISRYERCDSFYLFYCDTNWKVITDTCHTTLEDAMAQAEYEYEGVNETWQKVNGIAL
jgi:hypothetical protein